MAFIAAIAEPTLIFLIVRRIALKIGASPPPRQTARESAAAVVLRS
jgi:hypothetical protein